MGSFLKTLLGRSKDVSSFNNNDAQHEIVMRVDDHEQLAAKDAMYNAEKPGEGKIACQQVYTEAQDGVNFDPQSKGTWTHATYHLTSSTAGPPLLSLPFPMASLGWALSVLALALGATVSYYTCYLLSLAMEHMEKKGK